MVFLHHASRQPDPRFALHLQAVTGAHRQRQGLPRSRGLPWVRRERQRLARFSSALARFATAQGKPNLYHETITWAFLLLIRERIARSNRLQTWAEFSAANRDLLRWEDSILKKYYRPETLASALAKSVFLFPDKL